MTNASHVRQKTWKLSFEILADSYLIESEQIHAFCGEVRRLADEEGRGIIQVVSIDFAE